MNIIYIKNFNSVDDPVKTEETINTQLIREADKIQTDYTYVSLPLAWNINKVGVRNTQRILDDVCNTHSDKKLFFVCQHILVNKLNFHGHLVFTPHATLLDSYIPIPHYSCTYDLSLVKPWKERKYKFSFMGSFKTHPTRRKLYDYFKEKEDCLILDTGSWHFEISKKKREKNARKYIEILGDTKYSLCPRGTGPSTIRIWEALAMKSFPVILSDHLKMPLELFLRKTLWSRVGEECNDFNINHEVFDNREYWEWFCNANLYKSIINIL